MRLEDSDSFRNLLLMEFAMFDELQHKIRPRLAKQNTWYRQAIGPGQKESYATHSSCKRHRYVAETSFIRSSQALNLHKIRQDCLRLIREDIFGEIRR